MQATEVARARTQVAERDKLEFCLQQLQASELEALVKRNDDLCQNLRSQHAAERQQKVQNILQTARDLCNTANTQKQLLNKDRADFDKEKLAVCKPGPLGDVIELNVSGTYMTTTRKTLTQVEGSMFNERWDGCHKLDKEGRVFLDYSSIPINLKR